MKNKLTLLLTIFTISVVSAQTVDTTISEVYFRIGTMTAYEVKIDGEVYANNIKLLELPQGNNRIQVWAPGYHLLDTVVNLNKQQYSFKQDLQPLPAMMIHEDKVKAYNKAPKLARIPFYVAVPMLVYTTSNYRNAKKLEEEIPDLLKIYYNSPSISSNGTTTLEEARENYEIAITDYEKYYQQYYWGLGVTGALTVAGSVLSVVYSKKIRSKPKYNGTDTNPFKMTGFQINVINKTPMVFINFEF